MKVCASTINITCHNTVDGVPENSVQDRVEAVAMATRHISIDSLMVKTHRSTCTLFLISIHVTVCARTINVTCHSTVDGVPEVSVQDRAEAVAMATKHPKL